MSEISQKKIKIFSHKRDTSTNMVIDWLSFYNCLCIRTNSVFVGEPINIKLQFEEGKSNTSFDPFYSIWFRKNWFYKSNLSNPSQVVEKHLQNELDSLQDSIFRTLQGSKNKKMLGTNGLSSDYYGLDKIYVLSLANEIGLKIPATLISNNIKEISLFQKQYTKIISKPISDPIFLWGEKSSYSMYTSEVEDDKLPQQHDCFPSLVQESIEKEFEIRVFFLNNQFYSCAIFSQNDPRTQKDFRDYNDSKPNRYVPFKLPNDIKIKLKKLMGLLQLNTGSIDLIYSTEDIYYFLEINPVGQFGMISNPCNYYIEKEIAKFLCDEK